MFVFNGCHQACELAEMSFSWPKLSSVKASRLALFRYITISVIYQYNDLKTKKNLRKVSEEFDLLKKAPIHE